MSKFYDEKYRGEELYWGSAPSSIARILLERFPPQQGQSLIDMGCGEGKDALFFARNGYQVAGFDSSSVGITRSIARAGQELLNINFFQADINEYRLTEEFDVMFASGALHYIPDELRNDVIANYKQFTKPLGLHAFTVPIEKPFLPKDPEADELERYWRSGEILMHYHDWKIEFFTEEILDDIKSNYKFPVNRLIAREPSGV